MRFSGTTVIRFLLSFFVITIYFLFCLNSVNVYAEDQPPDISSETVLPDLFTGTLSYSVPIKVPSGRSGMTPNLNLQYRSTNRNGFLGMGWELEVGSIQIKNPFRAATEDPTYTFRKNGSAQDLMPVATGQYAPVIESGEFNRFLQKTGYDGRTYWEVTDKKGTVYTYGSTSSSSQTDGYYKWCLDKIIDTNGNYITFSYFKDNGQIYLDQIDYTGNGTILPTNSVKFIRETRSDVRSTYSSGTGYNYSTGTGPKINYRLKAIDVKANYNRLRYYALHYDSSSISAKSILTSIQEYGSDTILDLAGNVTSGTSLPPVTLGYQSKDTNLQTTGMGWKLSTWASTGGTMPLNTSKCIPGDYDGDGKTDLACWTEANNWSVAWSTGTSWSVQNYPLTQELTLSSPISSQCLAGDLFALGKTAIACYPGTGNKWYPFYSVNGGKTFGEGAVHTVQSPSITFTLPIQNYCTAGSFQVGGQTDIACYVPPTLGTPRSWVDLHFYADNYDPHCLPILNEPVPNIPIAADCLVGNFTGSGKDDLACNDSPPGGLWDVGPWVGSLGAWHGLTFPNGVSPLAGLHCLPGDFNGDGITDIACNSNNQWQVMESTGGSWAPVITIAGGPLLLPSSQASVPNQCVTGDFNGDGITDIACYNSGSSKPWVIALSTSTGYWNTVTWNGPVLQYPVGNLSYPTVPITMQCVVGDFNGDGKSDLACLNNNVWSMAISDELPTDLLSSVSNGFGSRVDISYLPSTHYQNTQLPFAIQTVSTITKCDNYSASLGRCVGNAATTSYDYSGGVYYIPTHDFRGFNWVKVTGPIGSNGERTVTETWFYQGNQDLSNPLTHVGYMKGKAHRVRVGDVNGNAITDTTISYSSQQTCYQHSELAAIQPYFTPPGEVDVSYYDGGSTPNKQTKTVYMYDLYGNVTEEDRYGDVSNGTDDRTITRTYAYNPSQWIVGLPATENVYQGIGTTTKVAGKTFYYDDLTDCGSQGNGLQTPVKGNLTRVVAWNNAQASNSGADTEIRMAYDNYGNLSCSSDANANSGTGRDGNGITIKPITITYDSNFTFPKVVTDQVGHATTTNYYGVDGIGVNGPYVSNMGLYGQIKSVIDPNNYPTPINFLYDQFGRQIQKTEPDGFWTSWTYPSVSNVNNQAGVVGSQNIKTANSLGLWTSAYFDGFGRSIMQKKSGPSSQTIATLTTYDGRGAVSSNSFPYFDGKETPRNTTFIHDSLGRVTQVSKTDMTIVKSCYSYPVAVTIDENAHRKRQTFDIYGQIAKVEEYQGVYGDCTTDVGTPDATTNYTYDIIGNLISVQNTNQNLTTMSYDSLGRKYYMSDPDMGVWHYFYDANGNLTLQSDANGQSTAFGYDGLNRVVWKDYGANNSHEMTYTYDEPTSKYPIGRLTSMADLSSTISTKYYYNDYRTMNTTRTIDGTPYSTTTTYDGLNRMTSLIYPDQEAVSYTYDAISGNLSKVSSPATTYATYSGYNALGQPGNITLGNGVATNYTYDTYTNRLHSVLTTPPGQASIVNLTYDYDNKGNIAHIYDLVSPSVSLTAQAQNYSKYPGKVHAFGPTGQNFLFDPNGNMTADGQRTITYNYDNMPQDILNSKGKTTFVYDGNGNRVKKISPVTTTTYIGNLFECITGNHCAKYIFAGKTRIAFKDENGTSYYHADHLGSTRAVTGSLGSLKEKIVYYPFGGVLSDTGSIGVNHMFTAQELDYETNLYNYGARLYDPDSGRFMSPDTIVPNPGNPQSLNRYGYVLNNPMRYIDPTGHSIDDDSYEPPALDLDTEFAANGDTNTMVSQQVQNYSLDNYRQFENNNNERFDLALWIYLQSTGNLYYEPFPGQPPILVGSGYAGHNDGLNNPDYQDVKGTGRDSNAGPLPQGTYTIEKQQDNVTSKGVTLPASMRLTPDPNNEMLTRGGFIMHGGDMINQTSSQGCIVMPIDVRNSVGNNLNIDNKLRVEP